MNYTFMGQNNQKLILRKKLMGLGFNFIFSFVLCIFSCKNKDRAQKLKYDKMICETLEDHIEVFNFNLLHKIEHN